MPLGPGSIAFVGFNADGNDNLAFVALEALTAGTVIHFNDNEWTGSAFNTGESGFSWTASGAIAAGTVVTLDTINGTTTSNLGTVAFFDSTNKGIAGDGEIVYAYVGASNAPTAFLTAVANSGFTANGATLTGTGLVEGSTALNLGSVDAGADIGAYNGARDSAAQFSDYAAILNTASNFTVQDAGGDQSIDGTFPDVPFNTTAFTTGGAQTQEVGFATSTLVLNEGNSGTTSFSFTVQRTGGVSGQVDFSGTVGLTSVNGADFGGVAPVSFSGSILDGASSAVVTVDVTGDTDIETDEQFSLTLNSVLNSAGITTSIDAAVATTSATIQNDDAPPSPLGLGSIAFTAFNAEANDNLAFVALEDIPNGTLIFFTDNEWTGAAFNTGESSWSWTATSTIAAGTVVTLDDIGTLGASSNLGTVVFVETSNLGISAGDDIVYAYVGASAVAPAEFLTAVANASLTSGASLTGTGLIAGTNALEFAGGIDIADFTGARNNQLTFDAYRPIVNTASNYATQNASGDQSADGISPDVPFDLTAFTLGLPAQTLGFSANSLTVTKGEGDAGTKIYSFVVSRTGGTDGKITFDGSFDPQTTDAADFGGVLPVSISGEILAGASSATVQITVSGDTDIESSEQFALLLTTASNDLGVTVNIDTANDEAIGVVKNDDAGAQIGGITIYEGSPSLEGDATPPNAAPTGDFQLIRIGSYQAPTPGAEVLAYENGYVFSLNANAQQINILSLTEEGAFQSINTIPLDSLPDYGGAQSVAVKNGVVAIAYSSATAGQPGKVALFQFDFVTENSEFFQALNVGVLPDQLTFTPDGSKILVANEAEALSASNNAPGSVSIIDVSNGPALANVSNTISFDALNGEEFALIKRGLAVLKTQDAGDDIEPEYIAVSSDGTRAYVTLQEANGVAVIDLTDPLADKPLAIQALGSIDRSLAGNAFDPSDQDGTDIGNFPVSSLAQPDAIATFQVDGTTYFVTANEGDARVGISDEVRLNNAAYVLDPTAFPNAATLKGNTELGRLNVITTAGDIDEDGDYDVIYTFGGRSISIYRQEADGSITKVRETGGEFERIIARDFPALHNTENLASPDGRSDNKGPEPEGVSVGQVGDRLYAFVGLERVGGVMVYDITDPANATFVTYRETTAQDFGPETNSFVAAVDSSTDTPILLSSNEISNTVTLYSVVRQTEGDDAILGGANGETFQAKGGADLVRSGAGTDTVFGGFGADTIFGGSGNDLLVGDGSDDVIHGGDNDDRIIGGGGNDDLFGGNGDDAFEYRGTAEANGVDDVYGGEGFDRVRAGANNTTIVLENVTEANSIERIASAGFQQINVNGTNDANIFDLTTVEVAGIRAFLTFGGTDTFLGSTSNDWVFGGLGSDSVSGAGGTDTIVGGQQADTLSGGVGGDLFDYNFVFESRFNSTADQILDFEVGVDKIDLSGIDANETQAGNQDFVFIGNAAFTGVAGELRIDTVLIPGQISILGDTNGNALPDLHIILVNGVTPLASDYIL
jgi:RTX calcium-binding nonapeptide repeat (4 copies)